MAMAPGKKGSKKLAAADVPWRSKPGEAPVPRISPPNSLVLSRSRNSDYALSIMKHPDPIGMGLAGEALVEAAGPDCIVPGLVKPIKVLGLQIWPIDLKSSIDLKALEPIGCHLRSLNKMLEKAFDLTQAPMGR